VYAKIYEQIFDSTLAENYQVRHVFEDLLKLADQDGVVDRTREAIARRTNVPLEIVTSGISELEKPDPHSRSKEHDGRRIIRLEEGRDWGWRIVNHGYYRKLKNADELRKAAMERMRNLRASNTKQKKNEQNEQNVTSVSAYASVQGNGVQGKGAGKSITDARVIIHYLNEQAGRNFSETDYNLKTIRARLEEPPKVDLDGVKRMIDRQCRRWKGDPKMDEFLRVATLFGKEKFRGYYDNRDLPAEVNKPSLENQI